MSGTFEMAPYIRAYTPIPAAGDHATFKAATKDAMLYVASNARVRLEDNLAFKTLMVRTATASLAHLDLHGRKLRVDSVVDTGDNVIVEKGTFSAAKARAMGFTWLEDAVGSGMLVVGNSDVATYLIFR